MTRIATINRALIAIGATELQSETAPNGQRYVAIYDDAIGALCSEYPWTHCTGFVQLGQLAVKPVQNQWLYAYALPSDMAGTPRALYDSIQADSWHGGPPSSLYGVTIPPISEFEIYEAVVYANSAQLWCRYTKTPNEAIWPSWFRDLAKKLLMAEYAIPAREDVGLREKLMEEIYGPPAHQGEAGLIAKCKSIDTQGKQCRTIQIGVNPLVAARWT